MSESFFGLRKRPFAALADVECFVPLEGICQAFDDLLQAAAEGQGIGVLTAPAGLGKTLACQRLARELSANFRVGLLPSGNFLTRRSLLQAILFELGHSFVRMGDQELRLALSAALHAIRPARRGLVLIVDEAHLLAARMLEELRTLLSFGEGGEPLVRLIVSGQLPLEETLSRPQCDAFNQRIACQVMLPSLSRDESSSYLTRRLAWAGANVSEVFVRDALTAICEAADGVPRCLHQLADHCLTIAASRSEKPIVLRTVREALDHLKQLPLAWAEPTIGRAATNPLEAARAQAAAMAEESVDVGGPLARRSNGFEKSNRELLDEAFFDTYPLQSEQFEVESGIEPETVRSTSELDSAAELVSPWLDEESARRFDEAVAHREPSAERNDDDLATLDDELTTLDTVQPMHAGGVSALEFGDALEVEDATSLAVSPAPDVTVPPETASRQPEPTSALVNELVDEEVVIDRYAALDSALNRLTRTMLNVTANARRKAAESIAPRASTGTAAAPIEAIDAAHPRFDIVMPEEDLAEEHSLVKSGATSISAAQHFAAKESSIGAVTESVREPVVASSAVAVAAPVASAVSVREATSRAATDERRPYQLLFSELRRRRRRV